MIFWAVRSAFARPPGEGNDRRRGSTGNGSGRGCGTTDQWGESAPSVLTAATSVGESRTRRLFSGGASGTVQPRHGPFFMVPLNWQAGSDDATPSTN
jgi:hypothetical protein